MPTTSASTLDNNLTTGGTNSQGLAGWASPYITNYLDQAKTLGNTTLNPYQVYQGPLTAGASNLQNTAFQGIAGLTVPSSINAAATTAGNVATNVGNLTYTPTTSDFNATQAQTYMNPYLQMSLNPQIEEARRQSQITEMANHAKLANAGAFGGSTRAIMDAENQRNLGTNLANITGAGYNTAYNNAMQQFNADQARKAQEAQFGANYGLGTNAAQLNAANIQGQLGLTENQANIANTNAQLTGGATERGITAEGIAADKDEFEKQRQYPYQQVQFMRDMISGMPISSLSNTPGSMSGIGTLLSSLGGGAAVAKALGYKDVGSLLSKMGIDLGP
jgi:hypothetical protein